MRHPIFDVRAIGRRSLDAVLFLAVATMLPALVLRAQLRPLDLSGGVALFYAPWTSAAEAAARATAGGATLLRFGAADFIVVVRPDGGPAAVDKLLRDGAWLAIDPRISLLCGSEPETS